MNINVFGDRIVVKPSSPLKQQGGIFIPENIQEAQPHFVVFKIGDGEAIKKLNLKIGDNVLCYAHEWSCKINEDLMFFINIKQICAVFDGPVPARTEASKIISLN